MMSRARSKQVTWSPIGITEARFFQIEPWRKIGNKPISSIRENDRFSAAPYRLPAIIPEIKPYFDYSTYSDPPPIYNLRSHTGTTFWDDIDLTTLDTSPDDNDNEEPELLRTTPIPLSQIYSIARELSQGIDYEQFITNSE